MRNTGLVILTLYQSNHSHQGWEKPGTGSNVIASGAWQPDIIQMGH